MRLNDSKAKSQHRLSHSVTRRYTLCPRQQLSHSQSIRGLVLILLPGITMCLLHFVLADVRRCLLLLNQCPNETRPPFPHSAVAASPPQWGNPYTRGRRMPLLGDCLRCPGSRANILSYSGFSRNLSAFGSCSIMSAEEARPWYPMSNAKMRGRPYINRTLFLCGVIYCYRRPYS